MLEVKNAMKDRMGSSTRSTMNFFCNHGTFFLRRTEKPTTT